MIKKSLLFLCSMLVFSCVKTKGYDQIGNFQVPDLQISNSLTCPEIAGVYYALADVFINGVPQASEKGLYPFVYGFTSEVGQPILSSKVDHLSHSLLKIDETDHGYRFTSIPVNGQNKVESNMSRLLNPNHCKNGLFEYPEFTEYASSEFTYFNERSRRWVGKLEDGSLFVYIQKHKYRKFLLSSPEPEHIFYRFRPYEGDEPH